jgi:hypothetical protein
MSERDRHTYEEALGRIAGLERTFRLLLESEGAGPMALMPHGECFRRVRQALLSAMPHPDRYASRALGDFLAECAGGIVERFGEHLSVGEVAEVFRLGAAGMLSGGAQGHKRALSSGNPHRVYDIFRHYLDDVRDFLAAEKRQAERRLLERANSARGKRPEPSLDELCAMRAGELLEKAGGLGMGDVCVADFWALQHLGLINGSSLPGTRRERIRRTALDLEAERAREATACGGALLRHYLRAGRAPDDFELAVRATAAKIAVIETIDRIAAQSPPFRAKAANGDKAARGIGKGQKAP